MIERMKPTESEIGNAIMALRGNGYDEIPQTTILDWITEQRLANAREYNARYGGLNTLQIDPTLARGTIHVQFSKPKQTRSYVAMEPYRPWLNWKRVGGLFHWRIGRVGGSFYIARARNV